MTTKKDTKTGPAFRAERRPDAVMDKEPEAKAAPVDPTLCQCTGVQRRWDGDGIAAVDADGTHWYVCAKCGKKYNTE